MTATSNEGKPQETTTVVGVSTGGSSRTARKGSKSSAITVIPLGDASGSAPTKKKRIKKTPCEKCPLFPQKEKYFVPGCGPKTAKLVLVGEAPGQNEGMMGVPFVGKAGGILNSLLSQLVERSEVYLTNAVKCWPGKGNVLPVKAISLCREAYLEQELSELSSERVVTLGGVPAHAMIRHKVAVTPLIGMPFYATLGAVRKLVLATWHPMAYGYSGKKQMLVDIKRALQWGLRSG